MNSNWSEVWADLTANLRSQPRCPQHQECVHVRTLSKRVINDVLEIGHDGIMVRSHETNRADFIAAAQFERWWKYLVLHKRASLNPDRRNNPDPDRSRLVGAIIATCLPNRVSAVSTSEIALR